ncbi:MAG: leucyl aminopeptidase [Rickettsiaceae bacterium]|jgi:leucyl aminopeptidase|nr:leucyl aminopeptidase [Rickettsiaceae bacterium]
MKINFTQSASFKSGKNSVLVLPISEEAAKKSSENFLKTAKDLHDFGGKSGQVSVVAGDNGLLVLFGIGAEKKFDDLAAQKIGGRILAYLNSSKIKEAVISFDNEGEAAANVAFGALLQSYRFNKYFNAKKHGKDVVVKSLTIIAKSPSRAKQKFSDLEIVAGNIFLTRDLVSEPSNELNPESYAKFCQSLKIPGLEVEVLGEKEMTKLGMHSLLGVGQGSARESKMVVFKYFGAKNKKEAPISFVGKGVTFDTGGISIKPATNMEDMKTDMAGSAVVVGLMKLLAERKAKVNAIGAIGLVENMPSGTAQKPGDVVRSMSGQTIEVINTDAEGRLVLADVLHYTNDRFKPKFIVDLATLTGAIIIALADVHAGLFSNDDELSKQLEVAGKKTGETLWRLPLSDEYDAMINSDIADMKNVGAGRGAGSTTAAQFLHRFVGKTKWAHLDIAGVAWKGKGDATAVKGATGFGVKLLNQLVIDNYES